MAEPIVVYTIGSSTRSMSEFNDILKSFSIELLVDVRRFPTSKFEHFKRSSLEWYLLKEGIGYLYMGDELGGYRSGGYEDYTKAAEFKRGLVRLEKLAQGKITCIMCCERLPWKCHRRFIASTLESEEAFKVVHILEKDKVWIRKR